MNIKKILLCTSVSFLMFTSCNGKNKNPNPYCYIIDKGETFKALNLADVQLEWADQINTDITIKPTITKMINETNPNIITLSGDYGWADEEVGGMPKEDLLKCVKSICDCLDTYKIPYYFVYGNHDREKATGAEIKAVIDTSKYGHIEKGVDEEGTFGNYTIEIRNSNDEPIHAIYMMDSRDYIKKGDVIEDEVEYVTNPIENVKYNKRLYDVRKGELIVGDERYDCIKGAQIEWYKQELDRLKCCESTIITHMPISGFTYAFETYQNAVNTKDYNKIKELQPIGLCRQEETCSSGINDHYIYKEIKKYGSTKNVIAGHDHINDFSLLYEGVRYTYAVKTGDGCYWKEDGTMNGATLLTIDDKGVGSVTQHYWNPFTNK